MKQVPMNKNHAPFKLNGQSRTVFGLLKAPELQRLSVTVKVLRVGIISVGVMTVGVLSVEVMTVFVTGWKNILCLLSNISTMKNICHIPEGLFTYHKLLYISCYSEACLNQTSLVPVIMFTIDRFGLYRLN